MRRLALLAVFLPLFGAGCVLPWVERPRVVLPEPLCLSWRSANGFRAWIDAYAAGDTEAVALGKRIKLPPRAAEKLIADLGRSLETGGEPSFFCTLDKDGRNVAWVLESSDEEETCVDSFYVSINGAGTTSAFTTDARKDGCSQLCKPKRLEENLLVWQCDAREADTQAAWTQLHMNRWTGETETLICQQDALGMPSGCVR